MWNMDLSSKNMEIYHHSTCIQRPKWALNQNLKTKNYGSKLNKNKKTLTFGKHYGNHAIISYTLIQTINCIIIIKQNISVLEQAN